MVLFSTKIWWTFDGFESGSCCTSIYNTIDNDDSDNDFDYNSDNDDDDDDDCSSKKAECLVILWTETVAKKTFGAEGRAWMNQ